MVSYENLIRLQTAAQIFANASLFAGLAFLFAGLIRARWVGLSKRVWVVLSTIGIWLLGFVVYAGTIAFTHSQPNGPHAFESYMDDMLAMQCVKGRADQACADLQKKCAERDPTHPACRILGGEDPDKFYSTSTRR
jgi:hypothetical protein